MKKIIPFFVLLSIVAVLFKPFIIYHKLPIPADTIVALYHPFRDLYAKNYPSGIPFKNFLITDPVRQQYPWRSLSIDYEKKGQIPKWNPYSMAGTPLLGNMQSAAYYPLNFLFFIFPFSFSWSVLIFLEPLMAGSFIYLYLNNLKLNRFASVLGAVTFSFCGFFTSWLEWGTIVHAGLWLPLILLSIDKIFSNFSKSNPSLQFKVHHLIWPAIFILSLAFAFFAGHLQTFFYLFVVVEIYFLLKMFRFGKSKKLFLLFLILNSIFIILTIVQWMPTLNLILLSARSVDQDWQKIGWFIPWQNLIQFIAPDFFGNPTTLNYWGIWNYAEFVGYVGVLPLIMSLYAIIFRKDKKTRFFAVLFFLSLIFSLSTFLAKLIYQLQVPFLSTTQPTRLLFITDFSLSVLAAMGMDNFIRSAKKKYIFLPFILLGLTYVMLFVFTIRKLPFDFSISRENLLTAKRNLYFPIVIFAFSGVIISIYIFIKNKSVQVLLLALIILLTAGDLLRFAQKFTPFTDQNYLFPLTKSIHFLQQQKGEFRIMTLDNRILPPNFSLMYKIQSIDGYDPLYLRRYGELIAAVERGKDDITTPFGFNRIITPHNYNSRLIDLMGVRYVLSLSDINSPKLKKVMTEGQTRVYENTKTFKRAFFVKAVKPVFSKKEAITALFDERINLTNTAVVENWDLQEKFFAEGTADIVEYNQDYIDISVKNNKDGMLVFMDTYYPTWHASICSEVLESCNDAKIYITDYNFRGVIVPAGRHKLIFKNTLF